MIVTDHPVAGKAKSLTCQACHGLDGKSILPEYPNLAGQHASYMEKALRDYRDGRRTNMIMAPMAPTAPAAEPQEETAETAPEPATETKAEPTARWRRRLRPPLHLDREAPTCPCPFATEKP